jgi:hypothetical protein
VILLMRGIAGTPLDALQRVRQNAGAKSIAQRLRRNPAAQNAASALSLDIIAAAEHSLSIY